MRLLLVHGIGQGGSQPADLEKTWIDTLREGYREADIPFPDPIAVDFPFYGDALDARVAARSFPCRSRSSPRAATRRRRTRNSSAARSTR